MTGLVRPDRRKVRPTAKSTRAVVHARWRSVNFDAPLPHPIYAPASQGELSHYDGVSWNTQPLNSTTRSLLGVLGAGVFLVGYSGQIYQSR
jgi:hypothetical protein